METQSVEINVLMEALSAMHAEFGVTISKDSKGHKGSYASLPCVLEAIDKMVRKHGMVLSHAMRVFEGGLPVLETKLTHTKSKQWITSHSILTPNANPQSEDQAWGGSTTYHRRYNSMMLVGIFADDDPTDNDGNVEQRSDFISVKQLGMLRAKIGTNEAVKSTILTRLKINKLEEMPWKEFNKVLTYVTETLAKS